MSKEQAKLDIVLRWREEADGFQATLIYDDPQNEFDRVDLPEAVFRFDTAELREHVNDDAEYGRHLSAVLFNEAGARALLERALTGGDRWPVQVRLLVDSAAPPKYQAIRWEALRVPGEDAPLTTRHGIHFSRFLDGKGWAGARPIRKTSKLRALVVVANPKGTQDYADLDTDEVLAPIDVNAQLELAHRALDGMLVDTLPDNTGNRPTLERIIERLHDGVDLLYLVCHGRVDGDQPRLYLEKEDGGTDLVDGQRLVERLGDLQARPSIAVLCSCQSGGGGDDYLLHEQGPLTPLGPLLAKAGVAVVVAMNGKVTMETTRLLLPKFFAELGKDGLADRAMSEARGELTGRRDWWMPVLFSRLKRARVWYEPGFGQRPKVKIPDTRERIREGLCTAIIGSGIAGETNLDGSRGILLDRESVAQELAEQRQIPMSEAGRRDLATVAQYISVDSGGDMPYISLTTSLRSYLKRQYEAELALDWRNGNIGDLIAEVGRDARRRHGENDLYTVLSRLQFPVYITTSWTTLLEDALTEAGRTPTTRSFDWHRRTHEYDYVPLEINQDQPLVYHLFGTFADRRSVVVTEDDYYSWLREWTKRVDNDQSIPAAVTGALADNSLLFLGYRLYDWEFRVLFEGIKSLEGFGNSQKKQHLGVQLEPESIAVDREAAQDYLHGSLDVDDVSIYWGSGGDFLRELVSDA